MKSLAISLFLASCISLAALAKDPAIKEYVLDEQTVYRIPVAIDRVTTVSFPGPISAIDAAQVTADPKKQAPFQIAHTKGSSFFSVRALVKGQRTNLNIRWNKKTYVVELLVSDEPLLSVIFQLPADKAFSSEVVQVTPNRLLALLDKAKAFPLLKAYHPETVAQVDYRSYAKEPRVLDFDSYAVQIEEIFRFNPEDTLVFRVGLTNKTEQPLQYAPNSLAIRVGERTYPQSLSDASGIIPPKAQVPAYFAITGTPNGGRNDIALKNDFFVILNAKPIDKPGENP